MTINDHSCSFDLKLETVTIAQIFPGWELLEAAQNWIHGHGSKLYHLSTPKMDLVPWLVVSNIFYFSIYWE